MNKTLRTKSYNMSIVSLMVILGLFTLLLSGCQQINDAVNSNKPTNTNTATNSNSTANSNASTNANANNNVTANSNANANTSASPTNSAANANSQASNTATAPKENVPLTEEAKVFKNNLVGKWSDKNSTFIFTEDKLVSVGVAEFTYRVLDEKTVELKQGNNPPIKATMKIEDDGNTLIWQDPSGNARLTRVK